MTHIVLHRPEIPPNTGNVARTCKATGSVLHLIEPLGFELDDAKMRRAGLDYWHELDVRVHPGWEAFLRDVGNARLWLFTTKAERRYDMVSYADGDCLVFGRETAGLPEELRSAYAENCLRVPMAPGNRSLNLGNAVALALYEALRQQGFEGLE